MKKYLLSLLIVVLFIGCSDKNNSTVSKEDIINYYGFNFGSKFKKSKNVKDCKEMKMGANSYITCEDKNNYFEDILVVTKNKRTIQIMIGKHFNNDLYGKNSIKTYNEIKNILSTKFKYNENYNKNKNTSFNKNFCSDIKSQGGTIYLDKFIDTSNKNEIEILLKGSKNKNNCTVKVVY